MATATLVRLVHSGLSPFARKRGGMVNSRIIMLRVLLKLPPKAGMATLTISPKAAMDASEILRDLHRP